MAQLTRRTKQGTGFVRMMTVARQHPGLMVAGAIVAVLALSALLLGFCSARGETFSIERSGVGSSAGEIGSNAEGIEGGDGTGAEASGRGENGGGGGADSTSAEHSTNGALEAPLVIDVDGAVVAPGVVEVPAGSRVADAIEAAGGLAEDADVSGINRAAPLVDGEKVYVPRVGEAAPASAGASSSSDGDEESFSPVNINTASLSELDELPGIGPATAQAIIDDREENGPFASIEDIMRVSGIGEKKFENLAPYICV